MDTKKWCTMVPCSLSPSGPLLVGNGPMGNFSIFVFISIFSYDLYIFYFLGSRGAFTSWPMGTYKFFIKFYPERSYDFTPFRPFVRPS